MSDNKNLVIVESPGVITVFDNIKSISHYHPIKDAIESEVKKGNKNLTIKLEDSFSITSSIIGILIKTNSEDDVDLALKVKDERAFTILEKLKLVDLLSVQRY